MIMKYDLLQMKHTKQYSPSFASISSVFLVMISCVKFLRVGLVFESRASIEHPQIGGEGGGGGGGRGTRACKPWKYRTHLASPQVLAPYLG